MKLIDLTKTINDGIGRGAIPIRMPEHVYQAVIHDFKLSSMAGTYLDLPGHIAEFDDGVDASRMPLDALFMVDTTVIRMDRRGMEREIQREELDRTGISVRTPGLLFHVLWDSRPGNEKGIPFFSKGAIEWLVHFKPSLLISNVYENHADPRGIFVELFKAGISCVCIPEHLEELTKPRVKICAIPLKMTGVVQLSCRLFAIEDE